MDLEIPLLLVRCFLNLAILSAWILLDVIRVAIFQFPSHYLHLTSHPSYLATSYAAMYIGLKLVHTLKNHLNRPKIQTYASYKVSTVCAVNIIKLVIDA